MKKIKNIETKKQHAPEKGVETTAELRQARKRNKSQSFEPVAMASADDLIISIILDNFIQQFVQVLRERYIKEPFERFSTINIFLS